MRHICFEKLDGSFDIRLIQTDFNSFTVEYGKQVKPDLSYNAAARELGVCLMHQAACDGMLDNRTRNEAKWAGDSQPFFHC